ncbi:unnamed protein product [Rotaria sp. Silwood1]|nr:unnamed protein product [Rotaria sp. Silwood1]
MHYSSTAFSTNGLPTIVANQANVTMGQRSNLSVYDVQALRRFYNCTASGMTLPPTTTPPPSLALALINANANAFALALTVNANALALMALALINA